MVNVISAMLVCLLSPPIIGIGQFVKPPPSKIKLKHKSRITIEYDRFKDQTTATVGPYFLTGTMEYMMTNSKFYIMGAFRFAGQNLQKSVEHASIGFVSTSKDWRFLKERDLYVLADGERFNLGTTELDSDVRMRGVSEFLAVRIPYSTLVKIANATKVEMKLGNKEFKLKDEHLEGFRDLASRMIP